MRLSKLYINHRWLDVNPQEALIRNLNHERIVNLFEVSPLTCMYFCRCVCVCLCGCSSGTNLSSLGIAAAASSTNDNPSRDLVASIYDVEPNLWELLDFHEETQGWLGTFPSDFVLFTTLGLKNLFIYFFFGGSDTCDRWEDPSAEKKRRKKKKSSTGAAHKGRRFTQKHTEWKESKYLQEWNVQHGREVAAALKMFAVLSTNWAAAQPQGWSVREDSAVHSLIKMSG